MRRIGRQFLLVCGGLAVGLLIAELALRAAGVSYPVFETYDAERGKVLRAGKTGWYRAEGEAYLEINRAGFRDREHALEKPGATYRIAVLGDSYVEAREVPLEATFWKRLEARLGRCETFRGRDVEVMSFGVSGYGSSEQLLTLRIDVLPYEPDLVLELFFAGNDIAENSPDVAIDGARGAGGDARPYFTVRDGQLRRVERPGGLSAGGAARRLLLEAIHYSRVLELVNQVRRARYARRFEVDGDILASDVGLSEFVHAPPTTAEQREAWEVTEALLTAMRDEARGGGADFIVVTATSPIQVALEGTSELAARLGVERLDYAERRIEDLGEREGFPVLTLFDEFHRVAHERNLHLHGFDNTRLGVGHWNADGHDLAATLIADRICGGIELQASSG